MPKTKPKIALVSQEKVGGAMAGPAIRYWEMAQELSREFDTVLVAPSFDESPETPFPCEIRAFGDQAPDYPIFPFLQDCTHVISQNLRPRLIEKLKRQGIIFIADLYDPMIIELLEYAKHEPSTLQDITYRFHWTTLLVHLYAADFILCASERQIDLYLGFMAGQHLITPNHYLHDPAPHNRFALAPFGFPQEDPHITDPQLVKDTFPAIKPEDHLIYWGGGLWNWFDPLSVIKAIDQIHGQRDDIKLLFLGVKHPNPKIKQTEMVSKAFAYCDEHRLTNSAVFFNTGWTPYQERANYLKRAHIGVSTHFNNLETHFSFRTRILDYLWAELPMIVTKGDFFAEFVKKNDLGIIVDYQDVDEIASAILELTDQANRYQEIKANIARVKSQFCWNSTMQPLIKAIRNGISPKPINHSTFSKLALSYYQRGLFKKLSNKL